FVSSRRRHTRFSRDWSSDVCSSDLVATDDRMYPQVAPVQFTAHGGRAERNARTQYDQCGIRAIPAVAVFIRIENTHQRSARRPRSEERRVGKERSTRGWPEHSQYK